MTNRYSPKHGRIRKTRVAIAVIALIAAVAIVIGIIALVANRQTLDGADVKDVLSLENNVASVTHTEEQRYYDIEIFKPDFTAEKLPAGMQKFYDDTEADFRAQLENLLADKALSGKDKATLKMDYTADAFRQFTTFTVNADMHVAEGSAANSQTSRRYAVNTETGAEYTAADLFKEDYDYKNALALRIAKQTDGDGAFNDIVALDEPFTDNVFMTSDGLRVEFDDAVGETVSAGSAFVIEYKYIYYGLSFELPDEYKPPEPNPIDPKKEKIVALTFDDGPSGSVTPKLLDLLKKYNAHATFFVVGEMFEVHPELITRELEEGHTVGLHTMHHTYFKTGVSVDKVLAAVEDEAKLIKDTLGIDLYYLRPPGGYINKKLAQTIGRPCIMWDVDPLDWKYKDADTVYDAVMNHVQSGDIVLSHDLYQSTYEAYARIIPELVSRGYRLVSLDELLGTTDPSIEGAYAGQIIEYRDLAPELRAEGKFD